MNNIQHEKVRQRAIDYLTLIAETSALIEFWQHELNRAIERQNAGKISAKKRSPSPEVYSCQVRLWVLKRERQLWAEKLQDTKSELARITGLMMSEIRVLTGED